MIGRWLVIRLTLCALALAGTAHAAPEIIIADFEGIVIPKHGGFRKTGSELFSNGGAIEASVKGWKIRSIYKVLIPVLPGMHQWFPWSG